MSSSTKIPFIDILARRFPQADRDRLLAAILCGDVLVAGERCREPKRRFPPGIAIEIANLSTGVPDNPIPPRPFVSRGGDKLEPVLEAWQVPVAGRVWLDAGCSTGGFTHCLLLRGATLVHAVDVGYNLLDWRLRTLSRVAVQERTNIMGMQDLDPPADAAVADLSFRSMAGAAAKILSLTQNNELYGLIKPQFERKYGLGQMAEGEDATEGFNGVVPEAEVWDILIDVVGRLAAEGIRVERLAPAGLRGRSGNQEYIALLRREPDFQDAGALAQVGRAAVRDLFG